MALYLYNWYRSKLLTLLAQSLMHLHVAQAKKSNWAFWLKLNRQLKEKYSSTINSTLAPIVAFCLISRPNPFFLIDRHLERM